MLKVNLEVSEEVYNRWIGLLKDICGVDSKKELEDFISSGIEGDLDFNDGVDFEKVVF